VSQGPLRRLHLIGDQGSGKTTLARRLGDQLAVPVHHLDSVVRDPATGLERSPDELRAIAGEIAASEAWVTEGLHAGWTGKLFERADRVVWLDTVGRVTAARRITGRFAGHAWGEMRRRGWRGLFRFGDYARHLGDLARTMGRVARTDRVAVRGASGEASVGDVEALLARHPERLVHCRTQADVEAFLETLDPGDEATRPPELAAAELGAAAEPDDGAAEPDDEAAELGAAAEPDDEAAELGAAAEPDDGAAGSRAAVATAVRQGRSDLLAHVRDPLFWHAYVLLLNTAITSGLGVLYWLLVARLYPQAEVGRNAAIIASITFVAGAAQLNLRPVLGRFVPVAGRRTGRLLLAAYASAAAAGVLMSLVYLVSSPLWAKPGPLLEVAASPALATAFVGAVILWTLFAIQDGALIGFRATVLLAVENALASVLKIVLVVAFAFAAIGGGAAITISWAIPIALAVVLITLIVARRLVPVHAGRRNPGTARMLTAARAVRYAAGDYVGSLFALAFTSLVPVIVLNQAGAEASARFYIVWIITTSLMLIPPQMVTSLVVDTARDPSTFATQGRRMLLGMLRVLLPLVTVIVIAAPLVLGLFGPAYAEETLLLRLLALSTIPYAVINLYIALARVRTRAGRIVAVQAAVAVTLITLTQVLLPRIGLDGVGYALLVTYGGAAVILLATELRPILWPGIRPGRR
jgi:O-antigen/teichoic acid export membrane protein